MSLDISSAQPRALYHYATVGNHINHELAGEANRLGATLAHFEATCREPGFALHVSYLSHDLTSYVRQVSSIDNWVREVGKGFERADRRSIMDMLWRWVRDLFQVPPKTVEDMWDDLHRKYLARQWSVTAGVFQKNAVTILPLIILPGVSMSPVLLIDIFRDKRKRDGILTADFIFLAMSPRNIFDIQGQLTRLQMMGRVLLNSMLEQRYHSIYEGEDWEKGPYLHLDPASLGRQPTVQDLAAVLEQMYRKYDDIPGDKRNDIDDAVQIVKVGDHEWAVFVIGTDMDTQKGANNPAANLYSGIGLPTRYQLYIQKLIKGKIPAGDKINFVGHSQGAYVVMNLADTQALADRFEIASVTTFAGDALPDKNPRLDASIYHNYLIPGDAIMATRLNPLGNRVKPIPDEPIFEGPLTRHTQYHESEYLAAQESPFKITQWSDPEYYPSMPDDIKKSGISTQRADRFLDPRIKLGLNIGISFAQHEITYLTEHRLISVKWRTKIDQVFDSFGSFRVQP